MAVKPLSLLLRCFVVLSFTINFVLIFRSLSNSSDRSSSQRFSHRAVPIEEQEAVIDVERPRPLAEPHDSEIPLVDAPKETPKLLEAPPLKSLQNVNPPLFNTRPAVIALSQYTQQAHFAVDDDAWTVYEDLSRRDGEIVFQSPNMQNPKQFQKTGEAAFYQQSRSFPKYNSIPMAQIGMAMNDMLADSLLKKGEPNEEQVKAVIPPMGSKTPGPLQGYTPPAWTSFVGTVEASDNTAVWGYGNTKSYQPVQQMPEISRLSRTRFEGRVGGWMPSVRKVMTEDVNEDPPEEYFETIVFGDVDARDPFIIQTWHRTSHVVNSTIVKVVYGHSYPSFPKSRVDPTAEEFYRALFRFGDYWQNRLSDMALLTLPDQSWVDMSKYAFAKELMVRPGGTYPKYGAIDRDYYGNEYDGFQDIFTSSLSANLEWGRFAQAWSVIDNYYTQFVAKDGSINMRGPEVGQFGLMLSMLAKYSRYTRETDLIWKHKEKIVATANVLIGLHNESLKLPISSPAYGLLHGWSESDACLSAKPDVYWQPYFSNSALAARGLKDISTLSNVFPENIQEWKQRASTIANRTIDAVTRSIRNDLTPPYVPPLPGTNLTFRESMAREKPSPQAWPHRLYAELVHAAILPANLTNLVLNTMRAYGATSVGVTANVAGPSRQGRDILGFISYGHALSLLLADRIDEFVLFMYTHRYHVHTRGAWNAGEVTDIIGGGAIFCMPAQLTIPSILRWALVLEHPDESLLYLGRGIPRAWLGTGKEIGIHQAPTRFGRVDFVIQYANATAGVTFGGAKVRAQIRFLERLPRAIEVKLRLPRGQNLTSAKVNGQHVEVQNESAVFGLSGNNVPIVLEGF